MEVFRSLLSSQRPTRTYKRGRQSQRRHQSKSSPANEAVPDLEFPTNGKKRARTHSQDDYHHAGSQLCYGDIGKPLKRPRRSQDNDRGILTPILSEKVRSCQQSGLNVNSLVHSEMKLGKADEVILDNLLQGYSSPDHQPLKTLAIPDSLNVEEVDMDIIHTPLSVDTSAVSSVHGRVSASALQKENRSLTRSTLRSPFRHTSACKRSPGALHVHGFNAQKSSFQRQSSAIVNLESQPCSNFKRSSSSHAISNKKSPLICPFIPFRDPKSGSHARMNSGSSITSVTSMDLSRLSFNHCAPRAQSSPAEHLLDLSKDSFSVDFPDAFSTPVSKRLSLLTPSSDREYRAPNPPRRGSLESPSPKPRRDQTRRRVRLPEDSIFTASLELSVSPTVKQPFITPVTLITPAPSFEGHVQQCTPSFATNKTVDPESPDLLDLFALFNMDEPVDMVIPVSKRPRVRLRSTRSVPTTRLPPLKPVKDDKPDELDFLTKYDSG